MNEDEKSIIKGKMIKLVIWFWVVVALGAVLYIIIISIVRAGKVQVVVKCAPYSSYTYIDNKKIESNTSVYLTEGKHDVLCFLPGFTIENQEVEINKDNDTILIELLPKTNEGEKKYQDSIDDYYDLEAFAGNNVEEGYNYNEKDKQLLSFLPYNTDSFGLGTYIDNDRSVVRISVWQDGYTQMAVNTLLRLAKDAGVSLASYEFEINGFNNQLQDFQDNANSDLESYIRDGCGDLNIQLRGSGTIEDYTYVLISVGQPSGGRIVYRALFKKENGKWQIMNTPYPILTLFNTPEISQEILDEVNGKEITMKGNT